MKELRSTVEFINKNFKKRECIHFVKGDRREGDDPSVIRCQCGRRKHSNRRTRSQAVRNSHYDNYWKWNTNTMSFCTDAFGEIQFYRYGMKPCTAKYVRAAIDSSAYDLLSLLHDYWGLKEPSLIISILGGKNERYISRTLKNALCNGLINLAKATAAYIITSGYHSGAIKYISKAINQNQSQKQGESYMEAIPIIGVSTWGAVLNRELIQGEMGKGLYPAKCVAVKHPAPPFLPLDPFHTHFILADDGSVGKYDAETVLQEELEEVMLHWQISRDKRQSSIINKVPVVHIVICGDAATVSIVRNKLKRNMPVLLVEDSGGAANVIVQAIEYSNVNYCLPPNLTEIICREFNWNFDERHKKNKEIIQECIADIQFIVQNIQLVRIFKVNDQLDDLLFSAIVYSQGLTHSESAQLNLKVMWNKIGKDAGFEIWNKIDTSIAMEKALIAERVDIVQFLLKERYGLSLTNFVTPDKLMSLYQSAPGDSLFRLFISKHIIQHHRSKSEYEELSQVGSVIAYLMGNGYENPYSNEKLFMEKVKNNDEQTSINTMAIKIYEDNDDEGFSNSIASRNLSFEDPYRELFIWAILTDRYELSVLLWQEINYPVAGALVAANILLRMSESTLVKRNLKVVNKLQEQASKFISLALGVINDCYKENREDAVLFFMQELPSWGDFSCFAIVFASSRMKEIIVHDCYYDSLNYLWTGEVLTVTPMWKVITCAVCPLLIFTDFIKFEPYADLNSFNRKRNILNDAEKMTSQEDLEREAIKMCAEWNQKSRSRTDKITDQFQISKFNYLRLEKFYTAPRMIFMLNLITYIAFLAAYGIFIISEFQENIGALEWILIVWVSALVLEEIRQVICTPKKNFVDKISYWWSDDWNKGDAIAVFAFYLSLVLRLFHATEEVGRMIYCVDFIAFCVRILQMLSIRVNLGPKLVMIERMITDLISFVIILFVFLAAFGIATQGILNPIKQWDSSVIKSIFYVPYYRIYGELFLQEERFKCRSLVNTSHDYNIHQYNCVAGDAIVNILLVIYLLLTTILLLNLLIAIFNNTYAKIEDEAGGIWRIQYNNLLREYLFRSPSVPPLNYLPVLYMIFPWNLRTNLKSWKTFLDQLANLKHLKIPRKKFEVYDICRLQYWEKEKLSKYMKSTKTATPDTKDKGKQDKFDICLSKLGELTKEISGIKDHVGVQKDLLIRNRSYEEFKCNLNQSTV